MSREKSCFGILFTLSIVIGIGLGIVIRQGMGMTESDSDTIIGSGGASSLALIDDSAFRRTYLIIGVDRLLQDAQLQGAWVVTLSTPDDHPAGTIEVVMVTLYPLLPEQVTHPDQSKFTKPHSPIPVDVQNLSAIELLEPLNYTDLEWSDVIILDEVAVNAAIQLSNLNYMGPISTPTTEMFAKSWENPEKSFRQQWGIITTLCTEPEAYGQLTTIQHLINLYGNHILSSLDKNGLLKLWQVVNYKQNDTIDCEIYPQLTH